MHIFEKFKKGALTPPPLGSESKKAKGLDDLKLNGAVFKEKVKKIRQKSNFASFLKIQKKKVNYKCLQVPLFQISKP